MDQEVHELALPHGELKDPSIIRGSGPEDLRGSAPGSDAVPPGSDFPHPPVDEAPPSPPGAAAITVFTFLCNIAYVRLIEVYDVYYASGQTTSLVRIRVVLTECSCLKFKKTENG